MTAHATEVSRGDRFEFGANWQRFLLLLNEDRIAQAEKSLRDMLDVSDLQGKRFLDVGSGSGLFSLAARRLGAAVHSFDYDPKSVACTEELRRRFFPGDDRWLIEEGSALDLDYVGRLGEFDVVYSWGVLHHTGAMWQALENVASLVASGGKLFIAIYNDQGWISRYWLRTKALYARYSWMRAPLILTLVPYVGLRWLVRRMTGRFTLDRGMSLWHDMLDWIGGFPFEVARPESVFRFYKKKKNFVLLELKTCGGKGGCSEFVFMRPGNKQECKHDIEALVVLQGDMVGSMPLRPTNDR